MVLSQPHHVSYYKLGHYPSISFRIAFTSWYKAINMSLFFHPLRHLGLQWVGNDGEIFFHVSTQLLGHITGKSLNVEKSRVKKINVLPALFCWRFSSFRGFFLGDGDFGEMSTLVNINFSRFDDTEEMDESFMRKIILYMPIDRFFFVLSFSLFTTLVNQCQASGNSSIRRYTLRILLWNALVR